MLQVDRVEECVSFKARKGDQLGSQIETDQHDGHHAVDVEKWQHADKHLLDVL